MLLLYIHNKYLETIQIHLIYAYEWFRLIHLPTFTGSQKKKQKHIIMLQVPLKITQDSSFCVFTFYYYPSKCDKNIRQLKNNIALSNKEPKLDFQVEANVFHVLLF